MRGSKGRAERRDCAERHVTTAFFIDIRGLEIMPFDNMTEPSLTRRLGTLEKVFWLADQHHPAHFAITAELSGQTRVSEWRDALD